LAGEQETKQIFVVNIIIREKYF